jgi:D-serine deaminase-like pyridoxal phosphate-dependent protein
MTIVDLDTPCVLVDLDRLESNIASWQAAVSAAGAALRPHVKTHKIPAIAKMQLAAGASGITVAKLAEAEVFAANGCDDIFVAYPLIGTQKWRRAADLARSTRLIVGVDNLVGARGLSDAAASAGSTIAVRVEIEQGMSRSGVARDLALRLCEAVVSLPNLELDGIFAYRSVFFPGASDYTADEAGRLEGEAMVAVAEELRNAGIDVRSVSVGSTPTARAAASVPGVTEVRPGTYVFGDYMMAARGVTPYEAVALSILCTVTSRPGPQLATVDGGSKTFSGDIAPSFDGLNGYARGVGVEAYVERMSEEHGVVRLGLDVDPAIGDRLAFIPIHVCTAVNLSDELIGIRNNQVEQIWPVLARGKRT